MCGEGDDVVDEKEDEEGMGMWMRRWTRRLMRVSEEIREVSVPCIAY